MTRKGSQVRVLYGPPGIISGLVRQKMPSGGTLGGEWGQEWLPWCRLVTPVKYLSMKPPKDTVWTFGRLADDGTRMVGGAAALAPVRLDVALPDEPPLGEGDADLVSWVRAQTVMLVRHAFSIKAFHCYYVRDAKDHVALTAARLAALGNCSPVDTRFNWGIDTIDVQADPAPPPLVGARTSTAPPYLGMSPAQLEDLTA